MPAIRLTPDNAASYPPGVTKMLADNAAFVVKEYTPEGLLAAEKFTDASGVTWERRYIYPNKASNPKDQSWYVEHWRTTVP